MKLVAGLVAAVVGAGAAQAQVPSYMPAVIGATVANSMRGPACGQDKKIPDELVQQWTPMLDDRIANYAAAAAASDASAARKQFIGRPDGGLYGADGQVHALSSLKDAFTAGQTDETGEAAKLTAVQTVFGGDFQSARGIWKAEVADGEAQPVLVADFQRDFWGKWKIWRLREFTAADAPSAPEAYCFAGELTKLW